MVGRAAIDVVLEEVRSGLDRVDPADLHRKSLLAP